VSCLDWMGSPFFLVGSFADCPLFSPFVFPWFAWSYSGLFGSRAQSSWRVALSIKTIESSAFPRVQSLLLSAKKPRRVGTYSTRYPNRTPSGWSAQTSKYTGPQSGPRESSISSRSKVLLQSFSALG